MKKIFSMILLLSLLTLPVLADGKTLPFSVSFWETDMEVEFTLTDIAYHNGTYVAVDSRGFIAASEDFENWTVIPGVTYNRIERIDSNDNMFVAWTDNSTLYSYDGYNWSKVYWSDLEVTSVGKAKDNYFVLEKNPHKGTYDYYLTDNFVDYTFLGDSYSKMTTYFQNDDQVLADEFRNKFTEYDTLGFQYFHMGSNFVVYAENKSNNTPEEQIYKIFCRDANGNWSKYDPPSEFFPNDDYSLFKFKDKIYYWKPFYFKDGAFKTVFLSSPDGIRFTEEVPYDNVFPTDRLKPVGDYIVKLRQGTEIFYTRGDGVWRQTKFAEPFQEKTSSLVAEWTIKYNGRGFVAQGKYGNGESSAKVFYYSIDRENWTEITYEQYIYANSAKWWGDRYLIRGNLYGGSRDNDSSQPSSLTEEWDFAYARRNDPFYSKGLAAVLDESFNVIAEYNPDFYIIDFAYYNGLYYIKDLFNVVSTSTDLENWVVDNNEGRIPLYNTSGNLLEGKFNGLSIRDADGVKKEIAVSYARIERDGRKADIEYETSKKLVKFQSEGDFYYYGIGHKLMVSKDGIYWTALELPDIIYPISSIYENCALGDDKTISIIGDRFLIKSQDWCFEFPLNDIYEAIDTNASYVKLNDKILAFDVPPVREDDRLLVPMRFLFEQMGDEVSWDSATESATVQSGTDVITFSINSTMAKVNGEGKVMDVPARLINGKTMVPLRFLSENLGCDVEWDGELNMATIITNELDQVKG